MLVRSPGIVRVLCSGSHDISKSEHIAARLGCTSLVGEDWYQNSYQHQQQSTPTELVPNPIIN